MFALMSLATAHIRTLLRFRLLAVRVAVSGEQCVLLCFFSVQL